MSQRDIDQKLISLLGPCCHTCLCWNQINPWGENVSPQIERTTNTRLADKETRCRFQTRRLWVSAAGRGYARPFSIAHVRGVIYKTRKRRRVDSPQVVLCGKLAAIVHCHAPVILPSARNMTAPVSLFARRVIYIQFPFSSSGRGPDEALSPPRTPWIDNAAVNSSSSWLISQVVTGRAARICWLSKVNGAGPLACSLSPSVWWLARDVRPGASITTARESHFSGRKRLDFTWPQPVALDQHAVVAQSWGSGTVGPGTADLRLVSLHAREFVSQQNLASSSSKIGHFKLYLSLFIAG